MDFVVVQSKLIFFCKNDWNFRIIANVDNENEINPSSCREMNSIRAETRHDIKQASITLELRGRLTQTLLAVISRNAIFSNFLASEN